MPTLNDDKTKPIEEVSLPSIDAEVDAPVLMTKAGISEAKLQEDLRPYEEDEIVEESPEDKLAKLIDTIPAHHLVCAYECLTRGCTVEEASRIANIPQEVTETLVAEVDAVRSKLSVATPKSNKKQEVPVIETPLEEVKG